MRIAYIAYEYPPDTAFGGIATYVYQASQLMLKRGHQVEVFTASHDQTKSELFDNILVHRIKCIRRENFSKEIVSVFAERHQQIKFDIIESPEFFADGLEIKIKFPELPLVVKLHTPRFLILRWGRFDSSRIIKITNKLFGLFKKDHSYTKENDREYLITKMAQEIHSPSISLGRIVVDEWNIPKEEIFHLPNVFIPSKKLTGIQPLTGKIERVLFIGRLERRKGIMELCEAMPLVLQKYPELKFLFVGKAVASPKRGMNMKEFISYKYSKYLPNIEFAEASFDKINEVFEKTQICVIPSLWDNFPYTCLEAMASAKAIVASNEGGMQDMLSDSHAGILINPKIAKEIADGICYYIENPSEAKRMGVLAREKVMNYYNGERIGKLMEDRYMIAIKKMSK